MADLECIISIAGACLQKWNAVKKENRLQTNPEMVTFLLDWYDVTKKQDRSQESDSSLSGIFPLVSTSTPSLAKKRKVASPGVSEISSETDKTIDVTGISDTSQHQQTQYQKMNMPISSSFVDPFQLSISLHEELEDEDSPNDPDYDPQIDMVLGPSNIEGIDLLTSFEEETFEDQDNENEGIPDVSGTGVGAVSVDSIGQLLDDKMCLSFLRQLIALARVSVTSCNKKGCNGTVDITSKFIGSALYLHWVCSSGHMVYRWCSQPTVKFGLHSGDLLTSASILFSGNNFTKVALMAKMLNLPLVSSSTYFSIQRHYLVPCVEKFWSEHLKNVHSQYEEKDIIVIGDGRMDSPGFCAQYCTYVFMEYESKQIVSIETMDKRQVSRKSVNMEKACFESGLTVMKKDLQISEVVTDAHLGIAALMRTQYANIKHSHDIWHAAKNIGKKIIKAGKLTDSKELLPWTAHLQNHFWYTSQTAKTYSEFLNIWYGAKHHVCGIHEWLIPEGDGPSYCQHGATSEADKHPTPLQPGSKASQTLNEIIMDPRLMKKVPYYLNFRSTSDLETFNSLVLMYASKRHSYSPPVYNARNLLAALDHNLHADREVRKNLKGEVIYHRMYNKKSGRWSVMPYKKPKQYLHIPELLKSVIEMRLNDKQSMSRKKEITDIRALQPYLSPDPPQSTSSLVQQQISRRKLGL